MVNEKYSKKAKLFIGVSLFILSYLFLNFLFSLQELVIDFTLGSFLSKLPYLWYIKALVSLLAPLIACWLMSRTSLDNIKSDVVGDGQYGTARWATDKEKYSMYEKIPFNKEMKPGYVVEVLVKQRIWVVDTSDQNIMQVAPPGAGKTKFCIIPTIYYNALVNARTGNRGASMILTDCKGELFSSCGEMLKKNGYRTPFLDFRNPLRSYRFNLLYNVNKYINQYKAAQTEEHKLINYGKAESYAKILSESIVNNIESEHTSDASQYFNETAKGLLTGIILLVSEYGDEDQRHIISVFRLIIELNGLDEGSSDVMQRSKLEKLLTYVDNDRIINYVGPAMKADARTSMNVFSSALGKLVAFIDAELEQMVCGHSQELNDMDFISQPTAIFLICPDENTTRHFFASLYIRYMMNDLLEQASNTGGRLNRDVLAVWDEFGNMPPIKNIDVLFTAARSRRIRFFISLQSYFQLEKNYSQKSAKIIRGACQMKMYTYLADEEEAKALSEALGDRTVQSGSVSSSTRDGIWTDSTSQSVQMIKRRLMTPDEIMQLPQGEFILRKAGSVCARSKLSLYWKYLKQYPEPTMDVHYEIRPIDCLTEGRIKRKAQLKKNALTVGMFD